MGREIRRVPKDWQHPKNSNGHHVPLFDSDGDPLDRIEEWFKEARLWEDGKHPDQVRYGTETRHLWEYDGGPPNPNSYMPYWPESERTHYQMYETCSEGTPISPVLESPEAVARWCADNGVSWFGRSTATYDDWLEVARGETNMAGMLVLTIPGET